jgi:hypothetical protein
MLYPATRIMLFKANIHMFPVEAATAASALPYLLRTDTEAIEALPGSCAR